MGIRRDTTLDQDCVLKATVQVCTACMVVVIVDNMYEIQHFFDFFFKGPEIIRREFDGPKKPQLDIEKYPIHCSNISLATL